jgi:cytoskeletal protein RodZ
MSDHDRRDYRSLGEILTDAREERGWSVEEVAERTKIAPRQIHSLEGDDLASLNGPVYARGFLRNLCTLYDLDRLWLTSKLEASLESVGESAPGPAPMDVPVSPSFEAPVRPDDPEPTESSEETTWTIETVDKSRVRRVRAPQSSRGPKWIWIIVALVFMGATAIWILTSMRSTGSNDRVSNREVFELQTPSLPLQQAKAEAEAAADEDLEQPAAEEPAGEDKMVPESPSTDSESTSEVDPAIVASSGTRVGDQERVPYDDSSEDGISSVLRMDDVDRREMTLRLRATGLVTVRAGYDGSKKETRQMRSGQSWTLRAFDHFAIEFSDVSAVVVEVDGVRREAPRGLRNEWIIYPLSKPSIPE